MYSSSAGFINIAVQVAWINRYEMFFEKNTDDQRVYRAKYGDNDCIMRIKKNIIPPLHGYEDWKITKEIIFFSLRRIKL